MAILPIHSALQNPNIVGAFQEGQRFGTAQRLQRQAEQEQAQLRSLAPGIQQGDPNAYAQAAVLNPEYAQAQQDTGDRTYRRITNATKLMRQAINTGNPQAKQQVFQQLRPFLQQLAGGRPVPEQWDDSQIQGFEGLEARLQQAAQPEAQQRNLAVSPGSAIVDPATGQVIYERPFAPAKPIWDSSRGVFINPPGVGGGAEPTRGTMEQDIALANEMVAAGVPPENVDAFLAARGQRAQAAPAAGPQAIPVQGVSPEPEISALDRERLRIDQERLDLQRREAERKASAPSPATQKANAAQATKTPQINNVERGLTRIEEAMKDLDGAVVNTGPLDQYVVGRLPSGQELEAAVGAIQNSMLALTRVPGVGSQSDLEAKIAALQYPSLGLDPEVNRRTLANLREFVKDLKTQIEGSGNQLQTSNVIASPSSEDEYNALPSGALFVDPDDGKTYRKP